ncbi:hypothetical protein MAPG_06915 [Magnaporthiopsis poae ATCC 64411]|uniref:Uncharacterized protein n=1 Tax=Magnaporthiopsis poae (strain ATCC 64411 / 73-15) TaxID=644358 RepID=A0A0C4E3B8_MAGP6|nr:hypothetical protein MAPG_06915 [Magnaporthiopsis poae ATCC 64411]
MTGADKADVKRPLIQGRKRAADALDHIDLISATAGGKDLAYSLKAKEQATASVTQAPDHEGDPEATPERGSWLRSLARDTLKSWGLHSLWIVIRRTSSAQNHVVIFKHRGVALLAAVVHILPLAGSVAIAWLLRRDRWIGATLDPNLNLVIQIAAKVLELLIMASLSAMIFTFVRSEVALGKGAPLAAYLAGGAIRSPAYIISDEFWGMARGTFSSNPKKYCFLLFSLLCCVVASLTAPFTAAALQPINGWFTTGGTPFNIDTRGYPLLPSRDKMITSNSTFGDGACAVAGNASCPSGGWESLLPLAALLPSINGAPGLWPVPYSEGTFTIAIRVHEPESRVLMPHRAYALGIGRVVVIIEEALRKTWLQERRWLRGSRSRYWTFGYFAGVITRCRVTVATQESLLQTGSSRLIVFPDVRSSEPLRLYQNMTIENPDLDRFLAARNTSTPQLFFFNPDAALAKNVSIASVVSLPLNGGDARPSSSVLYGCVSNTPWVEEDLETTQDRQMTGPAQPANVDWNRAVSYTPATVHTSYANLTNVPVEAAGGTTVFQRLAEAAGLGLLLNDKSFRKTWVGSPAAHRTAERTVHHVETLINLLLANGMSNTGAGAQPKLELRNKNGEWWRDFFPFVPQFGINQIRDVMSLFNIPPVGAFVHPTLEGVPEAHQVSLWFNAAMFGYGYSAQAGGSMHFFRMVWMFVYVAIAALFTLWSVCVAGISSSSWDSPIEVVALALRSPKPKGEIMPTSLVEDPSVLGECYCVVAEGRDLELRPLRDWEGEPVPEEMKVRPNEEYR